MFSEKRGSRIKEYVPDYVIFDLETTGSSPVNDEVIEIAGVKVRGGVVVDEFSSLVNPGRPISYWSRQITGITDEMVKDSPTFDQVMPCFMEFAQGLPLAGHNIHCFDMKFLYRDAMRYFGMEVGNDYFDTLYMARSVLKDKKGHRLTQLAEYYGISPDGAHRALCDCRMNQKVMECMHKDSLLQNQSGTK